MAGAVLRAAATLARVLPEPLRLALYRLGPLTRLFRALLNRAAPAGVHPVQVASGELAGMWLLLDLQVDKDLWLGTYEPQLAAAIHRFARPGSVVYDLGANVGYATLLLARAVGPSGQVFAFEPLPENLERLRGAISHNGLGPSITVVPAAVGASPGPATFLVHASGGMGRLEGGEGRRDGFISSAAVDVTTMDDFVFSQGHPAPGLIKMDLEGGEGAALRGMLRLLRERRPCLLIELHGAQAAAEAAGELRAAGYRLHLIQDGFPEVDSGEPARLPKHVVAMSPEART